MGLLTRTGQRQSLCIERGIVTTALIPYPEDTISGNLAGSSRQMQWM
jgi:hypothetical protein